MTVREVRLPIVLTLALATACGSSPSPKPGDDTGGLSSAGGQQGTGGTAASGGATASGGSSSSSSSSTTTGAQMGGNAGTGGSSSTTGGTHTSTTTGTTTSVTGGTTATGGTSSAGGTNGVGGSTGQTTARSGGSTSQSTTQTGGSSSRGGSQTIVGGTSAVGGQSTTGGATAWAPSDACVQKANALVEKLTPAQRYGQMTQADIAALTTAAASSAFLGSVLSGGNADPPGSNSPSAWASLISSYLNVAKSFSPHVGMLYGVDAIHGNNNVQDAVIFPHNIGLGASRNAKLVEDVTRITALEMLGVGANFAFAPTVAAALDERWGRTYEAFSETPDLAGELGAATVRGLQNGKLGSAQSVLASAKHYAGDGATDNGTTAGDVTSLDDEAFRKLAVEPYRASIETGVGSIMVSYSSYQGTKMTAAKKWLTEVLKGEFAFKGFLISDWDAVERMSGADFSDQVQTAINAGVDMVMMSQGLGSHTITDFASTLSALVDAGTVPEERIKDAVGRILTIKCEMGLLDGDTTIDPSLTAAIGSSAHRAVARDAVRQSMVLLKNDGVLPLSTTMTRVHVTGSGADSLAKQCGGWTLGWQGLGSGGTTTSTTTGTTVLASIKKRFQGTSTTVTSSTDGSGASGATRAIVVVGETPYAEEKGDKANPTLTTADFAAIAAVKAANVPFVVVLFSGRPLILTDSGGVSAVDEANAFMAAWLPGTEGDGIVDVLFGDYKPTGKLSFSWPASLSQIPINVGDGKTPLFEFGYGLTYP